MNLHESCVSLWLACNYDLQASIEINFMLHIMHHWSSPYRFGGPMTWKGVWVLIQFHECWVSTSNFAWCPMSTWEWHCQCRVGVKCRMSDYQFWVSLSTDITMISMSVMPRKKVSHIRSMRTLHSLNMRKCTPTWGLVVDSNFLGAKNR